MTSLSPVGSAKAAICAANRIMSSVVKVSVSDSQIYFADFRALPDSPLLIALLTPFRIKAFYFTNSFRFSYCFFSQVAFYASFALLAAMLEPKVATLRARFPTLVTWLKIIFPQFYEVLAAPIPHQTQPYGFFPQQTGPTPFMLDGH